ncbi:MAG: hypothetical protein ACLRSW_12510 [Christensenellaceae bacterium]
MMTGFPFDYNDAMDGYKMVDELATGDPVDVTSQYATEDWEISADDESRLKITIVTILNGMTGPLLRQRTLWKAFIAFDPRLKNYRADTVYANSLVIHNAKDYSTTAILVGAADLP